MTHAEVVTRVERLLPRIDAVLARAEAVLRGGVVATTESPAARVGAAPAAVGLPRGHAAVEGAQARELQILRALDDGAVTTAQIRTAVPTPPDVAEQQHRVSVQNALSRLKAKGLVYAPRGPQGQLRAGWALTAAGRKVAAKEEP